MILMAVMSVNSVAMIHGIMAKIRQKLIEYQQKTKIFKIARQMMLQKNLEMSDEKSLTFIADFLQQKMKKAREIY